MTSNNLVTLQGTEMTTTSQIVAEVFGKRHADVLRGIDDLISEAGEIGDVSSERNFAFRAFDVESGVGTTRQERFCVLTRDGFALLAMGFTGREALKFKLKFLDAFKKLEQDNIRLAAENVELAQQLLRGLQDSNQKLLLENKDSKDKVDDLEMENKVLVNTVKDYQAGPQQVKDRIDQGVRVKEQKYRRDMGKVQATQAAKVSKAVNKIDAYLRKHAPIAHQDLGVYLDTLQQR